MLEHAAPFHLYHGDHTMKSWAGLCHSELHHVVVLCRTVQSILCCATHYLVRLYPPLLCSSVLYMVWPYHTIPRCIIRCRTVPYTCTVLYCVVLCCIVLCCIVFVLCCIVLCCIVCIVLLSCLVLYCAVLRYAVLYCIALYCPMLHYTLCINCVLYHGAPSSSLPLACLV